MLVEAEYFIDVTNATGARVMGEEMDRNDFYGSTFQSSIRTLTTLIKSSKGQLVKWSMTDLTDVLFRKRHLAR
ncbi:MAG: hypothetical protein R2822_28975 [Spirosomataceae bacterium]